MLKEKNRYISPEIEIAIFEVADIVTSSGAEGWLGSDSNENVDGGGWT